MGAKEPSKAPTLPKEWNTEYEQAAADARSTAARYWQLIYIFLSAGVVALGLVTQQLLTVERHTWTTFGAVLPIGLVGASLGWLFNEMSRRQTWVQRITYARLREIEWAHDMRKHTYIDLLDNWQRREERQDWSGMRPAEQRWIADLERTWSRHRPGHMAAELVTLLTWGLSLGWLGLVIYELAVVVSS